ncbi:MAG: hypothetical protein ABFR53_13385, partial [Actinomycetota bacterium]
HFGSEQLFMGFYDSISSEPEQFLRSVLEHIGVDSGIDMSTYPLRTIVNRGPRSEIPERHREFLSALYADELAGLQNRFKDSGIPWLSPGGPHG